MISFACLSCLALVGLRHAANQHLDSEAVATPLDRSVSSFSSGQDGGARLKGHRQEMVSGHYLAIYEVGGM